MKKSTFIEFKNSLILVVGDLILDCYWYSKNHHFVSEQITPIAPIHKIKKQPGGAANVVKNLADVGCTSKIIGFIGMDKEGSILQKLLHHIKIDCDLIPIPKNKTITKIRVISGKKQLIRLDFQEKYISKKIDLLYKRIVHSLSYIKILVLSDYCKGTLIDIKNIICIAKKMSIPILIDPKGVDFKKYSGASLLTPNLHEFEKIVGKCYKETEILKKGVQLLSELQLSALLVTRSKNGMTLFQPNKKPIHFPATSEYAHDVTGAGDTVIAIIAAALSEGYSLEESCFYANVGAGVVIQKTGTATINIHELNAALHA
ncbi:D-glycero-beta-D-manno-heptose-7-phosphate kinase [Buchnera aphidicola (Hyadaphis tataricae)]|uniref:D-glycero-beta-D-manno-heptose-7-phosphate kinase n=1 Tax=Buchnera aphidicola (Hyadaphis tataricae) TaxID=1241859 RepID=A0A4D6YAK6_9GAMM|nr:D-glycero-beta-D-manno-heptose-7-phosphate kinase [Buchnera aphidicola]QCI21385.1 D-glycero-beta-D-manno-heptose-7-phosphate kinase [Buchnera aphidicola (Hyadaphis tataricae)]